MTCLTLQMKIFQGHTSSGGMTFALLIIGKIAAGATKATKETHKLSIISVNRDLKVTTTIV